MQQAGLFKKIWSEALPFVARDYAMKVDWLVGVIKKGSLTEEELAPYMHILLSEYAHAAELNRKSGGKEGEDRRLPEIFKKIPADLIVKLLDCTDIYDIPLLLKVVNSITVEEAILVLRKVPPVYEKRPMQVYDRVFQAIHDCDKNLLAQAKTKMQEANNMPAHFKPVYERFQEILKDKEVLSSLFPHAKAPAP